MVEADGWVTLHPVPDVADYGMPPPSFYEAMAKHCSCCSECSNPPCDGVCAGGMCDRTCRCDFYDDYRYDDDSDDYDGMSGEQAREGGGADR